MSVCFCAQYLDHAQYTRLGPSELRGYGVYICDVCKTRQLCDNCLFFVWGVTGKTLHHVCPLCVENEDAIDSKKDRHRWKLLMQARLKVNRRKSGYK